MLLTSVASIAEMQIAVSGEAVSRLQTILAPVSRTSSLCGNFSPAFSKHSSNKFVPLSHTGSLFWHIVPTIVVL